jgi:MerR family transcriptional regulator, light-induced transcriptional regulator
MKLDPMIERLFETLLTGDRQATRQLVNQAEKSLGSAQSLITELFWPTHQLIEKLYKEHQMEKLNHHMAVRLLRVCADQAAARLERAPSNGRTVFCCCGPSESEELGAQMAVDILEASGFTVAFAGAGIAADEVLGRVNEEKPSILMMFCSAPQDLPEIRGLIDTIRTIGATENTQIAVGGGVFNRAEGLAEEIGADIWARTPMEMVETLIEEPTRRAEQNQRTVGKSKKTTTSKAQSKAA